MELLDTVQKFPAGVSDGISLRGIAPMEKIASNAKCRCETQDYCEDEGESGFGRLMNEYQPFKYDI